MEQSAKLKALGLESVDDVVTSATAPVEPTEIVDVIPGEAEEIEIEVKQDVVDAEKVLETAETFGEVSSGLEAIRDRLIAMKGTTVSNESFLMTGVAIRNQLGRLKLGPRNIAGLESFEEPTLEIGVAPAAAAPVKSDLEEPETNKEADDKAPEITPEDQAAAGKAAGEVDPAATTTENATDGSKPSVESDESDVGGVADTSSDDAAIADAVEDSPVADTMADDVDAVVAETTGEDKSHRVEITITDDDLTVAIEGIDNFIARLQTGQEGLIDKAVKSISDTLAKVFKGYDSVQTRANNLVVVAKGLSGAPTKDTITTSSANKMAFKGKVDVASIKAGLAATKAVGKTITEELPKQSASKAAALAIDWVKRTEAVRKGISADMTDHDFEAWDKANGKFIDELSKALAVTGGDILGGKAFKVTEVKYPDGSSGKYLEMVDGGFKVDTGAAIPVPSIADIAAIAKSASEVAGFLKGKEAIVQNANKQLREALEAVNALHTDENTKRLGQALRNIRWIYSWYNRSLNGLISDYSNNTFSSLRSVVQFGEAAAKQYSGKAE